MTEEGEATMRTAMIVACIAAFALGAVQICAAAELGDVLTGKVHPLSLKAGELDGSWVRFTAVGDLNMAWAQMYAAMLGGQGAAYYTKGETVRAAGETYLVAYGRTLDRTTWTEMMRYREEPRQPEPLTGKTPLALSLLNLRTVGSLTNIEPFDLASEQEAHKESAEYENQARSLSNLKNLALALQMWMADHEDVLPDLSSVDTIQETLDEYVKNRSVFTHPGTDQTYAVNSSLSGLHLPTVKDPSGVAVFYEQTTWSDGTRGVGFLDGHAKRVDAQKWQEIKRVSGIR
jgi:hypothetical protein